MHEPGNGTDLIRGVTRRNALLGMTAVALAACTQTIVPLESAAGITIRNVDVSTDRVGQFSVRELAVTPARLAADLRREILRELGPRVSANGNTALSVSVERVLLVSPAQVFIAGGGRSFIDASVTLTRAEDGAILAGPTKFSGTTGGNVGGFVGLATLPAPEEDCRATIGAFAAMLEDAIFEGGSTLI